MKSSVFCVQMLVSWIRPNTSVQQFFPISFPFWIYNLFWKERGTIKWQDNKKLSICTSIFRTYWNSLGSWGHGVSGPTVERRQDNLKRLQVCCRAPHSHTHMYSKGQFRDTNQPMKHAFRSMLLDHRRKLGHRRTCKHAKFTQKSLSWDVNHGLLAVRWLRHHAAP